MASGWLVHFLLIAWLLRLRSKFDHLTRKTWNKTCQKILRKVDFYFKSYDRCERWSHQEARLAHKKEIETAKAALAIIMSHNLWQMKLGRETRKVFKLVLKSAWFLICGQRNGKKMPKRKQKSLSVNFILKLSFHCSKTE